MGVEGVMADHQSHRLFERDRRVHQASYKVGDEESFHVV